MRVGRSAPSVGPSPRDGARTSWPRANAHSTTVDRGGRHVGPLFRPAGRRGSRGAIVRRARWIGRWRRCVTPRQTCPRPNGFGRNLRSKTRWFTGFCNSHQVSHFATFFIDARAEISVAESRFGCKWHECLASFRFLGAWGAGVWFSAVGLGLPRPGVTFQQVRGSLFFAGQRQ